MAFHYDTDKLRELRETPEVTARDGRHRCDCALWQLIERALAWGGSQFKSWLLFFLTW